MKAVLSGILLFLVSQAFSQIYKDSNADVEDRVTSLLSQMTLTEKLNYVGGFNSFYIRGISRLGLPEIKMSDGPVGVRNYGNTTAYPAGICLASTWDTSLIRQEGEALGRDARARGVHILLAPGMNIYRAPMCGRNFEYFGEDPYLAGQAAASYIQGVQSQGVVCTAKHYAGNNQEWDRNNVSSNMDERTLQEIYLPAFKASVKSGGVGAFMNSYNLLNGIHATQNPHLDTEILRNQWAFDGFVMSDWSSTYNGLAAAKAGLDLEMPSAVYMSPANLQSYLSNGSLTEDVIDEKIRRILRIIFRFGFYDRPQTDGSIPLNSAENRNIALNVARSGIVLLQNADSILPVNTSKSASIALIGPNADQYVAGGGSSYTSPFSSVTIREGLQNLVGPDVVIDYVQGTPDAGNISLKSIFYSASDSVTRGLYGEYFNNQNLTEPFTSVRTDTVIDFHWADVPNISGLGADNFSIRWTGLVKPDSTGNYEFVVAGDDGYRLWVNNELVIDNWKDQAITTEKVTLSLSANEYYPVKLEYYENGGLAEISFGYRYKDGDYVEAVNAAKACDVAVVCVGFNSSKEGEGFDRTFELPDNQDSLILAVANANPNTIVIINAGGNVLMTPWVDKVKGIIHAWYPGQEGGTAIAEVLLGITNPSGKLPASFEKVWSDNPCSDSYYSTSKVVTYSEGIFMGYRYYDSNTVKPMFPFGFGLSYTSFEYKNLIVSEDNSGPEVKYNVSLDIKNTGGVKGAEVVQIYVGDVVSSVPRPVKELKAFEKVYLEPGETKTVHMVLNLDAFSYFSEAKNAFMVDNGDFEIMAASSSEDIRLSQMITISQDYNLSYKNPIVQISDFSIYPVPASDLISIQTSANQADSKLEIYDLQGRLMDKLYLKAGMESYNCSNLPEGCYIFRFSNVNTSQSKRIIIER